MNTDKYEPTIHLVAWGRKDLVKKIKKQIPSPVHVHQWGLRETIIQLTSMCTACCAVIAFEEAEDINRFNAEEDLGLRHRSLRDAVLHSKIPVVFVSSGLHLIDRTLKTDLDKAGADYEEVTLESLRPLLKEEVVKWKERIKEHQEKNKRVYV